MLENRLNMIHCQVPEILSLGLHELFIVNSFVLKFDILVVYPPRWVFILITLLVSRRL